MSTSLSSSLLVVIVGAIMAIAGANAGQSASDVCSGKGPELSTVSQLSALELGSVGSSMCESTVATLQAIVSSLGRLNLCSPDTSLEIATIKRQFLDSDNAKSGPASSVARFAKALAFEVSLKCKMELARRSQSLTSYLSSREREMIEKFERAGAFLLDSATLMQEDKIDQDEAVDAVQLTSQLVEAIRQSASSRKSTDKPYHAEINDFRQECARKLRPLYRENVATVVELARLGFDAKARGVRASNQDATRMLNIMIACEALDADEPGRSSWSLAPVFSTLSRVSERPMGASDKIAILDMEVKAKQAATKAEQAKASIETRIRALPNRPLRDSIVLFMSNKLSMQ